jgi:hypothetical protein
MWDVFRSEQACCIINFPYSTTCGVRPAEATASPTKIPTIVLPPEDEFEIVPLKFHVFELPNEVKIKELKGEMIAVLTSLLRRLAKGIPGLEVAEVKEKKVVVDRDLRRTPRFLERNVTLYFNVYVVRNETFDFGPLVIDALRDSYDEVLEEIR